jgi:hypothetical protein
MSNDGGPQHSAGAQFADSIAVPGAAAVCKYGRAQPLGEPNCITAIRLAQSGAP